MPRTKSRTRTGRLPAVHSHPSADEFRFGQDRHATVVSCRHVWTDGKPILLVFRDEAGDWQFLCGGAHGDDAECIPLCLEHVVSRDPSVNELAEMCPLRVATRDRRGTPWTVEDETPGRIRVAIAEYGWWVTVVDAEGDAPSFAYTTGLYETFSHPEIIVFGLPLDTMHGVLNDCGDRIRAGKPFPVGKRVTGVVGRYDVRFRAVTDPASREEYLRYACLHYGDQPFPVVQLVWPDKKHRLPGDAAFDDEFRKQQPLLP